MVYLIAAVSRNNKIGKDGQLPWSISDDLKYFKNITQWHPVVMGRKTYESIGYPLPNRYNIVLTRDKSFSIDGLRSETCYSMEETLKSLETFANDDVFVIGGGEIYKQFLPYADRLYLTIVDKDIDGDTEFPAYKEDFIMEGISLYNGKRCHHMEDGTAYQFTIWKRKPEIG